MLAKANLHLCIHVCEVIWKNSARGLNVVCCGLLTLTVTHVCLSDWCICPAAITVAFTSATHSSAHTNTHTLLISNMSKNICPFIWGRLLYYQQSCAAQMSQHPWQGWGCNDPPSSSPPLLLLSALTIRHLHSSQASSAPVFSTSTKGKSCQKLQGRQLIKSFCSSAVGAGLRSAGFLVGSGAFPWFKPQSQTRVPGCSGSWRGATTHLTSNVIKLNILVLLSPLSCPPESVERDSV